MTLHDPQHLAVRPASPIDSEAIAGIYNHYVANTVVTFEEEPVSTTGMARRLSEVRAASFPWLVAVQNGALVGYAYATTWRARCAYRFSAEVTAYVHADHGGRGIGSALYSRLFDELQDLRIHTAIGGIALPNDASVRLHERFHFKKVAHFNDVGFKFDRWIDVGYWQRVLNRS